VAHRGDTPEARRGVLARGHLWLQQADARIVRRFWVLEAGIVYPICPGCGLTLRDEAQGQVGLELPAGRAQTALKAGGLEALTLDLPIEPGELWYTTCHACLAGRAVAPEKMGTRIQQLVTAALAEEDDAP
jgi:hypothetical protein